MEVPVIPLLLKYVDDFHKAVEKNNSISAIASTSISLEITNTLKDCDNGYIEIRCVVKSDLVHEAEMIRISLKRLDEYIVFVGDGMRSVWKNTELSNRSGVDVESFIRDVGLSYLSIRIRSSVVNPQKDEGSYHCVSEGFDRFGGFFIERSTLEMLNITGTCTCNTTIIHFVS